VVRLFLAASLAALPVAAQSPAVLKVLGVLHALNQSSQTRQRVNFEFSEAEVNEYLRYARTANPRPGLDSLSVKFFPSNYVSSFVVLDFDAIESWRPGTIPSLLRPVLSGRKSVLLDLRITAAKSTGSFTVEKARFQDIPIPAFVVEKMIEVVAARQKEKLDTSKPFPLPMGLKSITVFQSRVRGEN
jgi:hypothetical protein